MNERLDLKAQNDNRIMTVLRLTEVSHEICVTNRGHLRLTLAKDGVGKDYRFVLDAVPVEAKQNKELLDLFIDVICPQDYGLLVNRVIEDATQRFEELDDKVETLMVLRTPVPEQPVSSTGI